MMTRKGSVTVLWNKTSKIGSEWIQLLSKLTRSAPSSFREVLLSEAKASNSVAASILLADKELAFFKYYGVSAYTRDRIFPYFSGLLNKSLLNSQNDNYTMRESLSRRTARVAFMITKDQREALTIQLGYSKDQIKKLKPIEALLILQHRIPPHGMEAKISTLINEQEQQPVLPKESSNSLLRSDNFEKSSCLTGKSESCDASNAMASSSFGGSVQNEIHSGLCALRLRQWFEVIEVQDDVNVTVGMYLEESEAQLCLEAKERLAAKHRPDENIQFKIKVTNK